VGSQVALSHVGGAVLIVLFTDIALKNIISNPETQALWVKGISYVIIMLIGIFMAFQAIQKMIHTHENVHTCGHCSKQHNHKSKKDILLSWAIGAVPCTGSLLILVYAMAYDVLWLGLFMVICIAIGMAITMTAIGMICIAGKKNIIDRISSNKPNSKIQSSLEFLGASTIIFIGYTLLSILLKW
jgi:nickel/cobalt exporter